MSTSGLFLLIALLFGVGLFIVWPLIATPAASADSTPEAEEAPPSPLIALRAEHTASLSALRDLEFDHQTGKLASADYRAQREPLIARGVETLRQIDALESELVESAVAAWRSAKTARVIPDIAENMESRIEMSVAARRRRAKVK